MKAISKIMMGALLIGLAGALACCSKSNTVQVGIVLPTKDEPRWIQDEKQFTKLLTDKNIGMQILFSQGDSNKEKQNVEALLNKGIKVLILCPQDGDSAAAAAEAAKEAGVTVISYDRLITNTSAVDYYVTFDSFAVGATQGQFLIDSLPAGTTGAPLYLYAGAAFDNNSFIFFDGAWSVLQPKIADGTFVIENSSKAVSLQDKTELSRAELSSILNQVTTNWDFNVAKSKAADHLTAASAEQKGNVYVLAPNDGTARSIADEFAKDPDIASYVITGQDAEIASVQYIIDGKQSMTVWKNTLTLAEEAFEMAASILEGKLPLTTSMYDNGKKEVPAKQTAVTVITKDNVKELETSGYIEPGTLVY
ncbi:MAG: sugar ABC transporter substrate-binding protein [Treponema sp.]